MIRIQILKSMEIEITLNVNQNKISHPASVRFHSFKHLLSSGNKEKKQTKCNFNYSDY
jgi:hypothetical protein